MIEGNDSQLGRQELRREAAAEYVRVQLSRGLVLGRSLISRLDGARYSAFLPPGISDSAAHSFADGLGLSPARSPSSQVQPVVRPSGLLAQLLYEEIRRRAGLLVVEDHVATAGIPAVGERSGICQVTSGDDVYYLVNKATSSPEHVESALRRGTSYMAVAVLAGQQVGELECGSELSPLSLLQLANDASIVVIGAYDREGYVIAEL